MTTMLVFAIFDSKAGAFLNPFFEINRAVAIRSFMNACQDPNGAFAKFPSDFALYEIGEWDMKNGKLSTFDHENLGLASQYMNISER